MGAGHETTATTAAAAIYAGARGRPGRGECSPAVACLGACRCCCCSRIALQAVGGWGCHPRARTSQAACRPPNIPGAFRCLCCSVGAPRGGGAAGGRARFCAGCDATGHQAPWGDAVHGTWWHALLRWRAPPLHTAARAALPCQRICHHDPFPLSPIPQAGGLPLTTTWSGCPTWRQWSRRHCGSTQPSPSSPATPPLPTHCPRATLCTRVGVLPWVCMAVGCASCPATREVAAWARRGSRLLL